MDPNDRILNESWVDTHRFTMAKIFYTLSNIIFMAKVEGVVLQ